MAVDAAGVAIIDSWFAEGKKSGKYPGLTNPDDAQILAKVRVLKQ